MTLDLLPLETRACIIAVDWARLVPEEAQRLQALGVDRGSVVSVAHRGIFAGRDPIALSIGRMTVALRRAHAQAIEVEPL